MVEDGTGLWSVHSWRVEGHAHAGTQHLLKKIPQYLAHRERERIAEVGNRCPKRRHPRKHRFESLITRLQVLDEEMSLQPKDHQL